MLIILLVILSLHHYCKYCVQIHNLLTIIAIVCRFEFDQLKKFSAFPSEKPHILFYSNGLAIWQGLPNIGNINEMK